MREVLRIGSNGGNLWNALHHRFPYMRRRLERSSANGFLGVVPSHDRHWRRVPKVDILPSRRATSPTVSILRAIFLVVLLGEAFFIQGWYRERVDAVRVAEETTPQLQAAELQLSDQQQAVDALRNELSQLQNRRSSREEEYQAVAAAHIDWSVVLSTLFEAEAPGASFLSVFGNPDGEVTLEGIAIGPVAMSTLPTQLTGVSDVLDLQSLRWEPGSDPPAFTAIFRVRR